MILTKIIESISEKSIKVSYKPCEIRWVVAILNCHAQRQTVAYVSGLIFHRTCETTSIFVAVCHISPSMNHVVEAVSEKSLGIMLIIDKEMFELGTSYLIH